MRATALIPCIGRMRSNSTHCFDAESLLVLSLFVCKPFVGLPKALLRLSVSGKNASAEAEAHPIPTAVTTKGVRRSYVSAMKPPTAGPMANPKRAVVMSGDIVRARLSGVDISERYRPDPADVIAPPMPVIALAATNAPNVSPPRAKPKYPMEPTAGPITSSGFLPARSARAAAGTLQQIRANADAPVTAPSSDAPMPTERARTGRMGH
mmetsp:Transcript_57998/g.173090  ORF Transcript_57998/g.173090 Transcript_57998/m.173090 type:complete len:209 (-) Transcript_57998:574-1200(-)